MISWKTLIKYWPKNKHLRRWLRFAPVGGFLLILAFMTIWFWPRPSIENTSAAVMPADLLKEYSQLASSVRDLEKRQHEQKMMVVSDSDLNRQLSLIEIDATAGNFSAAREDARQLRTALANWNYEISGQAMKAGEETAPAGGIYLPILMYHYPPPNFEAQLNHLEQAGYTTIDLDQAAAGLRGGPLPPKPVVITFDDGFAVQMSAVNALLQRHMKATFYIIDGGAESRWCIGAGRRYNDPLQPPTGCGDAYLTWDQVRQIDRSGLLTIGAHTVNHRNLASLTPAEQRYEIVTGKQELEQQLGHSVRHFAYPYGAFNADSITIAREAGFVTAVTTNAGDYQTPGSDYTLRRVRDALILP